MKTVTLLSGEQVPAGVLYQTDIDVCRVHPIGQGKRLPASNGQSLPRAATPHWPIRWAPCGRADKRPFAGTGAQMHCRWIAKCCAAKRCNARAGRDGMAAAATRRCGNTESGKRDPCRCKSRRIGSSIDRGRPDRTRRSISTASRRDTIRDALNTRRVIIHNRTPNRQ